MYRLFALIIKELQSLLQEPKTRVILFMPVIVQMILFPFAATLEVNHSKIGIFNQDGGSASIELTQRIASTNTFSSVLFFYNDTEIKNALDHQEVLLVIHFPPNFSRSISHYAHTQLMVLLDGRKSNSAQIAANYISQIIMQYQHELLEEQVNISKSNLIVRNWYNPNLEYRWFVVPALVSLITTIGIMIVTSLSIVREREEGTLDQLLVSPLTTGQIFAGKAIPALIVATLQATIVLIIGIFFYKIPFAGSLLLFYGALLIYGLSLVGFGLLISSLCSTQQQAFIGVLVFMMPSILLSGYISPIENMPEWLQSATYINPIRHFMEITKQIYLKDAGFSIIWHSVWPLMIITLITSSISYYLFGKKIS